MVEHLLLIFLIIALDERNDMAAHINVDGKTFPLDTSKKTVLEAIQDAGIDFAAPCGGRGTCKKCAVWVRDERGLRSELACQIAPTGNMVVQVERAKPMTISETGLTSAFTANVSDSGYGIAIDVGTTTVVVRLIEMASGTCIATTSRPNPQIVFGSDVIARISASVAGSLDAMTKLIDSALAEMVKMLCAQCKVDSADIVGATLAGNTVMESIAAGVSPDPIGVNPFIPLSYFGDYRDIPGVHERTYFVECMSGYVGGDITADIVATRLTESPRLRLMLDLGTNGEMALGNKDRLITCATAAGPVFEGANITFGMPARIGAINRVEFDGNDIVLNVIGDAVPFGICGTGIIDATAILLEAGIVDETGYMSPADELDDDVPEALAARVVEGAKGAAFKLADNIYLTQGDIRNVQLAKAAVSGGVLTLADIYGVTLDQIDELVIAGGFGSFLNIDAAARIGLFPAELKHVAKSIGNTAIEGAMALLINVEAREQERRIAEMAEYIELSTELRFNQYYVDCMMF